MPQPHRRRPGASQGSRPKPWTSFKLDAHQRQDALARRAAGEALRDIARTCGVSAPTIWRLEQASLPSEEPLTCHFSRNEGNVLVLRCAVNESGLAVRVRAAERIASMRLLRPGCAIIPALGQTPSIHAAAAGAETVPAIHSATLFSLPA